MRVLWSWWKVDDMLAMQKGLVLLKGLPAQALEGIAQARVCGKMRGCVVSVGLSRGSVSFAEPRSRAEDKGAQPSTHRIPGSHRVRLTHVAYLFRHRTDTIGYQHLSY